MNKRIIGLIALSLMSTSALANKDTIQSCYTTEQSYNSHEQAIYDSVDEGQLPNYLDRNYPVEVVYTSERCTTSSIGIFSEGGLPDIPGNAQEGDSRTVVQTRGNVKSTYTQLFEGGRWVTKKVVKVIITLPIDPV